MPLSVFFSAGLTDSVMVMRLGGGEGSGNDLGSGEEVLRSGGGSRVAFNHEREVAVVLLLLNLT